MIHLSHLSVSYGPILALQDVSLDIQAGECVLITGPSGCGKSTLAKVLSGLIPHAIPASMNGTVQVGGMTVQEHTIPDLAQQIGIVFQNPSSQLFHLRVDDEIAFGPRNLGLDEDEVFNRVEWALKAVDLTDFRDQVPAVLSGGQKQLVAIAAALAMFPQILVLDEPTASLDVPGTEHVMGTLGKIHARYGVTIVLIEHRLAEAARLAERVVLMDEGRIIADGETGEVLSDRPVLRSLGLRRPTEEPVTPWQELLTPNGQPAEGVDPLLELSDLSAGYNGLEVIKSIYLRIYPGEFIALVGNNGAGKSTLGLLASGLLKPTQGTLVHNGGKRPRPGLDVSMVFQNPADQLFTDTVDEEVAFGPQNYRCFNPDQHRKVLEEADLLLIKDRKPTAISVGQQQRTAVAACLALRPQLLILDEPTLGQDWGHLERLMDFLITLNRNGTTILLITHDYKLVHRYARRVLLMEAGRLILDGKPSTLRQKS